MRLLILTQKVDQNDDVLGFFHRWIIEFAKHCEQVTVIVLGVGDYDLPSNVHVFSLGKEHNASILRYVVNFYRLIWHERKNYDAVFVHMNPIYVVLGGLLWKALGKKIGLWYMHKNVDMKLLVAEKLSNIIFTGSRESFRLASNKVKVVGHGIDTEIFKPTKKERSEIFHIITAGRISPIKDYQTLIETVEILVLENIPVKVDIIGGPATASDVNYLNILRAIVQEKKLSEVIRFTGPVPNKDLPALLGQAELFINMSRTGSLDKAILEAMACGLPVVTSNESLSAVFGLDAAMLVFPQGDVNTCIARIKGVRALSSESYQALTSRLRAVVEKEHNIKVLIPSILSFYETSR